MGTGDGEGQRRQAEWRMGGEARGEEQAREGEDDMQMGRREGWLGFGAMGRGKRKFAL